MSKADYLIPGVIVGFLLLAIVSLCIPMHVGFSKIEETRINVERTLSTGDYTYIVDGTELKTIGNDTLDRIGAYNVAINHEGKKVVLTTRPDGSTKILPMSF